MKFSIFLIITLISLIVSTKRRWYRPWRGGYWPRYYGWFYGYPYFFYFKNANDAPTDAPSMYKLPDDLTDICANPNKGEVCGFDKDKKIVDEFDSICEAGENEDVEYIVCGKCPDKDGINDKSFELPLVDEMPKCDKSD